MKISVIVPVYGVEKYIERCAESLFSQSLNEDVEFIFIDDASTDKSWDILEQVILAHPERSSQVKLIRHSENRGLPAARNTGLDWATGDYIIHIDGDDFVEHDMLVEMLAKATAENADIVWTDIILNYDTYERYLSQPNYNNVNGALRGILLGKMKYNVWNKLIRRDLYQNHGIRFPEGLGMGEDMTIIKLFCNARRVAYIPKAYYHYVKSNTAAFSQTYSQRHLIELSENVKIIEKYLEQYLDEDFQFLINSFKLEVKYPFLISDQKEKHIIWENWFKESNRYVWKNNEISLRRRILQTMAAKGIWWFVNIYYLLFYKSIFRRIVVRLYG